MGHIELARWADAMLVAPASADFIARLAQGSANDLLAAICLACEAPLAVAPAMNRVMWENAATVENIDILSGRGIRIMGPARGSRPAARSAPAGCWSRSSCWLRCPPCSGRAASRVAASW